MAEYLIRAENIVKSFPGVMALKRVRFDVKAGEVHALLGENGAGKSTLVKILSGVYKKDSGAVYYEGKNFEFNNTREAQDWGIGIIHQELNLCQHLTVAQNIFLGRENRRGLLLNERAQEKAAGEILGMLGIHSIDPGAKVSTLPISSQQIIEIAKALSMHTKVLIMDEPTSALTENEIGKLFEIIHQLRAKGIGIVYISHRLEELWHIADRVSIYRDGEYIATRDFQESDVEEYIRLMVGRKLQDQFPRIEVPRGEKVLEVKNVSRGKVLHNCGFDLYRSEILAFAGLAGAGRSELARAVFGADPVDSMELYKDGVKISVKNTRDAIRHGISYAPEDRNLQGLALGMTVGENITLASLETTSDALGVIQSRKENELGLKMIDRLHIKTPSLTQKARNLSGGNQQKLVVAKWLLKDPDVLIFDEPTRGIDVGAKVEIYNILNNLKKSGKAIIVISSELPEVLGISDRVLVMCGGEVKAVLKTKETDQEEIMSYATKFELGGNIA